MWQKLDKRLYSEALFLKRLLVSRSLTMSVAESCTGGEITSTLTKVPGASQFFVGGVVVYWPSYKIHIVGVPRNIVETYGTVSYETAYELAKHIRVISATDIGLSVVCVLGPKPDEKGHSVGTTYIAVAYKDDVVVRRMNVVPKSRVFMKKLVALKALRILGEVIGG